MGSATKLHWSLLPLALLWLALTVAAQVEPTEKPFLWMIEGQKPSFLYGTIHLPDERVVAIPQLVLNAADSVDALYVEVTPDELASAAAKLMLPDGKTLQDVLPEELYQRASGYVESKGLPFMAFQNFKIWVLMVQIEILDYIQQMAVRPPLDLAIYSRAQQAGKEVGGIETLEEQLAVFDDFTEEEQIQLLSEALDLLEENPDKSSSYLERLLLAYLEGDEDNLHEMLFQEIDQDDPLDQKFVQNLFTGRNQRMADRIASKLESNPSRSYFFAIGAGHLVGEQSVRKQLESRGFRITRLTPADAERFK
ncbi:MAG: TraB/GumN family protein [Acidobacteriota bacterium]